MDNVHLVNTDVKKRQSYSCKRPWQPIGLCDVEAHYQLTDGGEVVSLTRRQAALYPQGDSWYSFLLEAESTPGPQCGWKD
jgi:hypothetical protein